MPKDPAERLAELDKLIATGRSVWAVITVDQLLECLQLAREAVVARLITENFRDK